MIKIREIIGESEGLAEQIEIKKNNLVWHKQLVNKLQFQLKCARYRMEQAQENNTEDESNYLRVERERAKYLAAYQNYENANYEMLVAEHDYMEDISKRNIYVEKLKYDLAKKDIVIREIHMIQEQGMIDSTNGLLKETLHLVEKEKEAIKKLLGNSGEQIVSEVNNSRVASLERKNEQEKIIPSSNNDNDLVIRQVMGQNVTAQKAPSNSKFIWIGKRGNGKCVPDDKQLYTYNKVNSKNVSGNQLKEWLKQLGNQTYVEYSSFEPNFMPFIHLSNWNGKKMIFRVEVEEMDTVRNGGTYSKASIMMANNLGVSRTEINQYMKKQGLVWHECGDLHTIIAIPQWLNEIFSHTGGIGIQKDLEAFSEYIKFKYGRCKLLSVSFGGIINRKEFILHSTRVKKQIKMIKKLRNEGERRNETNTI